MIGQEAPAVVIVGIADHHLRQRGCALFEACVDRAEAGGHQRLAEAFALPPGHDRDRADHDHRMCAPLGVGQRHRPQLDGAGEVILVVERSETRAFEPVHPRADAIGGARMPLLAERRVEQLLDQRRIDCGKGDEASHGPRRLGLPMAGVDQFRLIGGEVPAAVRRRRLRAPTAHRRALRRSAGYGCPYRSGRSRAPCRHRSTRARSLRS